MPEPVSRPSSSALTRYLRRAESGVHASGWNRPSFLAQIAQENGKLKMIQPLRLQEPVSLSGILKAVENRLDISLEIAQRTPGLIALVYCHETWADRSTALGPGTQPVVGNALGDRPGAPLVRNFCVVDVWGRAHVVYRERGLRALAGPRDIRVDGGRVFVALTRLLLRIGAFLEHADVRALASLGSNLARNTPSVSAKGA